jgi:hypothetical protein
MDVTLAMAAVRSMRIRPQMRLILRSNAPFPSVALFSSGILSAAKDLVVLAPGGLERVSFFVPQDAGRGSMLTSLDWPKAPGPIQHPSGIRA